MRNVEPNVRLLAWTMFDREEAEQYVNDIGGEQYQLDPDGKADWLSALTAFAGKICYRSFQPLLNKNVKKVREDIGEYIDNIHKVGHGSVLEHASMTFMFENVSRVFTHELVRHRVGVGISQESMRYVALDDLPMWMPKCIAENQSARDSWRNAIRAVERSIGELQHHLIKDDMPFSQKKFLTSHIRRLAPQGIGTAMVWTANVRSLRHIIQLRTSRHAEEEIRLVFNQVATIVRKRMPMLLEDMECTQVQGYGEWLSKYPAEPYTNQLIENRNRQEQEGMQ